SGGVRIKVPVNNSGTVQVLDSYGSVGGSGVSQSTGNFIGATNTGMEFDGPQVLVAGSSISAYNVGFVGTATVGGSYNASFGTGGIGTVHFTGSVSSVGLLTVSPNNTFTFDTGSSIHLGSLDMEGGTLNGSDSMVIDGAFTWRKGTISGTGSLEADGVVTILDTLSPKNLVSRALTLVGDTYFTTTGNNFRFGVN